MHAYSVFRFDTRSTTRARRSRAAIGMLAVAASALAPPLSAQSLKGSPESVDRMYEFAVAQHYEFFETTGALDRAVAAGRLVPMDPGPGDTSYELSGGVGFSYATPEARRFIEQLAPRFVAKCGMPMVVTSAARPSDRQPHNANPKSVHPTGIAVDIRRPYAGPCLDWLRATLAEMEATGRIEATEEHHPPHFHVAVLSRPGTAPHSVAVRALAIKAPAVELPPLHPWLAGAATLIASRTRFTPRPAVLAMLGAPSTGASPAPSGSSAAPSMVAVAPARVSAPRVWTASAGEVGKSVRPNTYRVRTGDTLWSIAKRFGVTPQQLAAANRLSPRSPLRPNVELHIPG